MTVQSYGKQSNIVNEQIKKELIFLDSILSTTNPESDIYKINHSKNSSIPISPITSNLLKKSIDMAKKTEGALNPTLYPIIKLWGFTTKNYKVPDDAEIKQELLKTDFNNLIVSEESVQKLSELEIDLGAIGKGYAGDRAIEIFKENGITSALLDLGGNIQALGAKPDGSAWTIGIKNPWDGSVLGTVKIINKAVITSGGYERFFTTDNGSKYIHIFDPETGYPVKNGISSVTVICDSGFYGDALSTSLFVMGIEKASAFWKNNNNFEMIILMDDKTAYITKDLISKVNLFSDIKTVIIE